jgi:diguanylate cyclase (GGDEF)-like protein
MPKPSAASTKAARLDIGDLVREASEILAEQQPLEQSASGICALLGQALGARSVSIVLDDVEHGRSEYRYDQPLRSVGDNDDCSAQTIPLQAGSKPIGAILLVLRSRDRLTKQEADIVEACARYIAVGLRNARLADANENLERLIEVDPLTEVGNRRRFDVVLGGEWRRCARKRESLSTIMVDVDYFKEFNDRYGHVAGDACLRQIARAITSATMRASDVVTRYGGEEFAVVLPETDLAGAVAVGENIRLAVERLRIPHIGSSAGFVSISAGIATAFPGNGGDPACELVESADLALYRAKSGGRNRIVTEGYVSDGPVVERRAVAAPSALPTPLTSFFGRADEIAEIDRLMQATRIVTLCGPGGVGKTRVALELGASHAAERSVTFVDLAPALAGSSVAEALAAALSLRDRPSQSAEQTVLEHLQMHGGLIVFDNCEHLVTEVADLVERILRAAPGVTIVATSREPLGIRGEGVYRLRPLDEGNAMALFTDRARLVNASFTIGNADAATIAAICRRLDGLPLAIELAAPRLRTMSLEQIEKALDSRFVLLSDASRGTLARQQTLLALIRWSYDLLAPMERRAFERLSVLVGTWEIAAAAAIADCANEAQDLVGSLVNKSLLIAEYRDGRTRYRFLESTRAFAQQCLHNADAYAGAARAHARYFLGFVIATMSQSAGDDAGAFEAIRAEYDNVQAALHWAIFEEHDIEVGIQLAQSLWPFWQRTGSYRDAKRFFERALALDVGEERKRRFAAFIAKASMHLGETEAALQYALPLVDRCIAAQDHSSLHIARRTAALAYFELNDLARSREQIRLMLDEPCPGTEERALSLVYLAYVELSDGNLADADRLCEEAASLDVSRALSSWIELYRAFALFLLGKTDEAIARAQTALAYEESVHNATLTAIALVTLGWCWIRKGDLGRAQIALRRALEEPALARRADLFCRCFEGFAMLAEEAGEYAKAATIFGFVEAESKRRKAPNHRYEVIEQMTHASRDRTRKALGAAYDTAFSRGCWLSAEGAQVEALSL